MKPRHTITYKMSIGFTKRVQLGQESRIEIKLGQGGRHPNFSKGPILGTIW